MCRWLIVLLALPLCAQVTQYPSINGVGGQSVANPLLTVATLPSAASASGKTFWIGDSSDGTCGNGSGTKVVACTSNGTAWTAQSVGSGATAPASGMVKSNGTVLQAAVPNADYAVPFPNTVVLDGSTYTSLGAAYAALPSTGGTINIVPGYSETMTADITLTKPMVHINFLGPATITMGSHVITTGTSNAYPSISGLAITGPVRGSNDAEVAGMPGFIYTGTGTAITLGASNTDVYGLNLENFSIDVTGAGSAAKGIALIQVHELTLRGVNLQGKTTSGNSQVCLDSNGNGSSSNFNSYQTFTDLFIYGCTTGVILEGPVSGNNGNTFIGGSIQTNTTDGTGVYIADGDTNNTLNLDVHNSAIGVRFGANATRNVLTQLRIEANTKDVQFDSGATFNGSYSNAPPAVTDNSGVSSNFALMTSDKATINSAFATSTASSGNIQQNLQYRGNLAPAGLYRVTVYTEVTTAATAGTYGIQVLYTDDAKSETLQMVAAGQSMTSLGATQGTAVIRTSGSANIAYKVAVTGITGTPSYTAYATLEKLSQ